MLVQNLCDSDRPEKRYSQLSLLTSSLQLPQLRPYQHKIRADLYNKIRGGHKRILVCAPTGSGKTIIVGQVVYDAAIIKNKLVLFIVHRDVLISQTLDKFAQFGITCGVIAGTYRENRAATVQVASVQTLSRRDRWFKPDVVVFDECHLTAWSAVGLEMMPKLQEKYGEDPTIFIGLTATPWRLSKWEEMGDLFQELVCAPMPCELIEQGYLVKPVYYGLPQANLKGIRITAGDYNVADLERRCNTSEVVSAAVREWKRVANGRRTIAFAVGVEHARAIADAFKAENIPAACVHGEMCSSERQRIYKALATGDVLVVASCEALAEGFDVPEVSAILLCRPTKSKAKYFQQLGRGLRVGPYDDKNDCIVLDQAGLVSRFGFVEDLMLISLRESPEQEKGAARLKECPSELGGCGALIPTFATQCPHCMYEFPQTEKLTPIQNLERMLRPEDKPKFKAYRDWLNKAFLKGYSPILADQCYKDKYQKWPPYDWRRGAIFGDYPTEQQHNQYWKYLTAIAFFTRKNPVKWIANQFHLEFGNTHVTTTPLSEVRT